MKILNRNIYLFLTAISVLQISNCSKKPYEYPEIKTDGMKEIKIESIDKSMIKKIESEVNQNGYDNLKGETIYAIFEDSTRYVLKYDIDRKLYPNTKGGGSAIEVLKTNLKIIKQIHFE